MSRLAQQLHGLVANDPFGLATGQTQLMEQVVAENPANPEAFGRQAQLLYQNDRVEDAEAAIMTAAGT